MAINPGQQPPAQQGPVAQQLAKVQSNGHESAQPASAPLKKQKKDRVGFSDKTLWDWLNLMAALLVPLMIGLFTLALTIQQSQISQLQHDSDQAIAIDNRNNDLQIADDQQKEAVLKAYLDDTSNLILNNDLLNFNSKDEVRVVARIRTLTAVRRLDSERKGILIRFLYEAGLIKIEKNIIALNGADLDGIVMIEAELTNSNFREADLASANLYLSDFSGADLRNCEFSYSNIQRVSFAGASLSGATYNNAKGYNADFTHADLTMTVFRDADINNAHFKGANLRNTNMIDANLNWADLSNANLTDADLSGASLEYANLQGTIVTTQQLSRAKSLKGAIMPDGSRHP